MRCERILLILLLVYGIGRSQINDAAVQSFDSRHAGTYPFSSPFTPTTEDDQPVSLGWAAVSLVTGALVGTAVGGAAGALLPHRWSDDAMRNGFRGAIVGACLGPFFMYEMTAGRRDKAHRQRRWGFQAGANITDANYDNGKSQSGFTAGFRRSYALNRRLDLTGSMQYTVKRFSLNNKRIVFATPTKYEIRPSDIDFNVGYLDINVVPAMNVYKSGFRLGVGAGLMASIQLVDRTHSKRPATKQGNQNDMEYDFIYETDEPGEAMPYAGYCINLELEQNHVMSQFAFKNAFGPSRQMSPILDATRLRTFQFSIAFILP